MSIHLSISKMCSSFIFAGKSSLRAYNTKRKRSLGTQHYQQFISKERAWPLNWRVDLGNQFASLKTTVKFMTFVAELWMHISWFYEYYCLDLDETDAKVDALFCP